MAAVRAAAPWVTIPRRPGACPRSATAPVRRARTQTVTSSAAVAVARRVAADEPFLKEGALGRGSSLRAHRGDEQLEFPADDPHVVTRVDDLPRVRGTHDCRP